MKALLALIKKLYGSKALSKTIGTRTNVIKLPDKDTKRFLTNELNIDAASDAAIEKAYQDVEKLIPEIPKMNDQEILTFTGNLRRLDQRMNPPSAEVIEFGTKQPVSPAGIKQLETELGIPSDVDPQSPLGQIMTKTKQIEKEGKDLAKEFEMENVLKEGLEDLMKSQKGFRKLQDEGLVRATAREIMLRDAKVSGKLPVSTEEANIITGGRGDPIEVFRKYYGEDALEQLDSLTPKFRELRTSSEAADLAQKEFKLEPKAGRNIGSYDPENPPEFATGGRVGLQIGGTPASGLIYRPAEAKGLSPVGTVTSPRPGTIGYMGPSIPKLSEVDRLANQYIRNTTGEFIDLNENGIDDRLEEFATGGRVHAAAGLMKGMIKWLVENRNFAKELLDRVSKQKNGEKLIKELYESETKKSGVSPMSMGEAPKTNLPKVRAQKKADEEGIKQLAQDEQIPVRDDTIIPEDVMTVPEPFKGKYKDEFLAHDALYGRRSGDNKVDAEAIAETVADMQGKVYDDLGYSERMDMYDKAYGYLSLLDRVKGAMKESKGRTKQAGGGLAYLMGL